MSRRFVDCRSRVWIFRLALFAGLAFAPAAAAATLVRRCPEIELLLLWTNDSGAGLSWSPGLYAGPNGKARHQRRPMAERIRDFYDALQQGARDAGGSSEVGMWMVREPDVLAAARELRGGTAVNNTEGPAATAFSGPTWARFPPRAAKRSSRRRRQSGTAGVRPRLRRCRARRRDAGN